MNSPDPIDPSEALRFDPFPGDFGEPGDRALKGCMVRARSYHDCHWRRIKGCGIREGEQYRYRVEVFSGELMTFRFCKQCCVDLVRG